MDSAIEETLLVQENQSWHDYIILNELYDLKDCQIAQNATSNERTIKNPEKNQAVW